VRGKWVTSLLALPARWRENAQDKPRRRRPPWRVFAIGFGAGIAFLLVVAVIILSSGGFTTRDQPLASPQPVVGPTTQTWRQGSLALSPGDGADLDSLAPDWAVSPSASANADVRFDAAHRGPTGVGHGRLTLLPSGDAAGFTACADTEGYRSTQDLAASDVVVGRVLCDLTSQQRVASLRITAVHRDSDSRPDELTFAVLVWAPRDQM
jgi:hypothetical protein